MRGLRADAQALLTSTSKTFTVPDAFAEFAEEAVAVGMSHRSLLRDPQKKTARVNSIEVDDDARSVGRCRVPDGGENVVFFADNAPPSRPTSASASTENLYVPVGFEWIDATLPTSG